jgi:acylphosphatase
VCAFKDDCAARVLPQGVYYRDTTTKKGEQLGLTGVAYNLADGRVEIVAEGTKSDVEQLISWCWKGPEGAEEVGMNNKLTRKRKVTMVEVAWELEGATAESRKFSTFTNGGKK